MPKDVLRELPIATHWSDIDRVVSRNAMLRAAVNKMIANITKATIGEKKRALKAIATSSANNFQALFNHLLVNPRGYDFDRDKKSIEALRHLLTDLNVATVPTHDRQACCGQWCRIEEGG